MTRKKCFYSKVLISGTHPTGPERANKKNATWRNKDRFSMRPSYKMGGSSIKTSGCVIS
jgi:hypothetical protein